MYVFYVVSTNGATSNIFINLIGRQGRLEQQPRREHEFYEKAWQAQWRWMISPLWADEWNLGP